MLHCILAKHNISEKKSAVMTVASLTAIISDCAALNVLKFISAKQSISEKNPMPQL